MNCIAVPKRWVLAVVTFFGTMNAQIIRLNLSTAITAMVDYKGIAELRVGKTTANYTDMSNISTIKACSREIAKKDYPDSAPFRNSSKADLFLWDESTQGLALGAYYYGYISSQIIGAYLARKVGQARLLGYCMTSAGVSTILIRVSLRLSFSTFVMARILVGLFTGVTYPLIYGLWTKWAPPSERGKLIGVQNSGRPVGSVISLPLCAFVASRWGWAAVFYVTGTAACVWGIICIILLHDSPSSHPCISPKEKQFILTSLGNDLDTNVPHRKETPVPWVKMLSSRAMICLVIAFFATDFGICTMFSLQPTYLRTLMGLDVAKSGLLCAIPYLAELIMYFVSGILVDCAISSGLSTEVVRKISSAIGTFVPAIAIAASGYINCDVGLVIFLFSIFMSFQAFVIQGFKTSVIEIAPSYATIIYAIVNTIAMTSGFLPPLIAGGLLQANSTDPLHDWRILFWIVAAIEVVGGSIFVLFGTSQIQEWATSTSNDDTEGTFLIRDSSQCNSLNRGVEH